jgi:uncharacterized metal-binding protein
LIALFTVPIPQDYKPNINEMIWLYILGLAIGINYINPDLDKNNTHPDQHWGLYGKIWNLYAFFFAHRGISHWAIGFTTRYLFLLIIAFVVFFVGSITTMLRDNVIINENVILNITKVYWNYLKVFYLSRKSIIYVITAGIMTADILHIIEDEIGTFLNKFKRG